MWDNLKASIASVVRTNDNQEITGANLQNVLNTIVNTVGANATFAGIATPSTNPGTPDGPVFYIACEPGVYSNFNLTLVDGLYILENKTGSWVGTQINTGAAFEALIGYYNAVLNGASITVPDATTYRLTVGGDFKLKMLAPGTTATTLTIGNATNIPIWYNGAVVSSDNTWEANEIISVFYDGTHFMASNSQGGGDKFATGQKVRETSIIHEINTTTEYSDNDIAGADAMRGVLLEVTEFERNVIGTERHLTSSDFTQGSLNPSDGGELSVNTRLRTGYIQVNNGQYISVVTNGQKYLLYYYDEQKEYDYSTSWLTNNDEIPIVDNGYIRVLIAKSNDSAITPSELTADVSIISQGVLDKVEEIEDRVEEIENSGKVELPPLSSSDFEQGSIDPDNGAFINANTRIRTTQQIKVYKGTMLSVVTNGQDFVLDYYSADGAFLRATEWSSIDSTITFDQSYLIRILVRKRNNGSIIPSELQAQFTLIVNETIILQGEISTLQDEVSTLHGEVSTLQENTFNSLFLGTLVQKAMTASGLTDSTKRVSMQSCCAVPFVGATLRFTLPDHYFIGIRSGNQASNLSYNDYWYKNGDTYTFRSDVRYFRLCFIYSSSLVPLMQESSIKDITVETVQGLIDSNDIVIHEPNDISLFERNSECEKYAKAVMRPFVSGATNNYSLKKLPIFLHTSDIHGDAKRFENFMDYADFLEVDAALISGDMVAYNKSNSKMFIDDIASLHSTADLQCLGNHEAYTSTIQEESEMLASCIQRNSCTVNSNEQYPTYYYKDIAGKNMRIIALNLYSVLGSSEAWSFSQAECEWFIATLASTPANYGVIVMMHAPEVIPPIDEQYGKFRQAILNYTSTGALAARPLANIIDAFIGKESRTITYTSHNTTISVSADFTSVNSGVEFIAYVNGHLHTDTIGFLPDTTHRQLVLNVCCGISIYGTTYPYLANNSDLPRDGKGATQDSFNLYAIDRSSGTVRVAKIGSNTTGNMETRDWMIIPYKDIG